MTARSPSKPILSRTACVPPCLVCIISCPAEQDITTFLLITHGQFTQTRARGIQQYTTRQFEGKTSHRLLVARLDGEVHPLVGDFRG